MRFFLNIFWSAVSFMLSGGVIAHAQGIEIKSPLKENITERGVLGLVEALLNDIVLPIGASVAALAIIYSGFLYVKAQGNEQELKKAHEAIKWTIVGTAVILGASAIAQLISVTIGELTR